MADLSTLSNPTRPKKLTKLLGRGNGCKKGKTCGRGEKGAGSRSGYRRRFGYEGGQMRLHMKVPKRGFSNFEFRRGYDCINLFQIEESYVNGEIVSKETLVEKGLVSGKNKVKLLGEGTLTKKVSFEVHAISAGAKEKLESSSISFTLAS